MPEHYDLVTPVILTWNEEENIQRTLGSLSWAKRVVVVDSGSSDSTCEIARSFDQVAVFQNPFESYAQQWRFAVFSTGVITPFIVALDADMQVPPALAKEMAALARLDDVDGGVIGFDYRIMGRKLVGSALRPQLRLLRVDAFQVQDVGHGHLFIVQGKAPKLRNRLIHDDRKSASRFLSSQVFYSARDLPLMSRSDSGLKFRLRRSSRLMPLAMWLYAYFRAGGPFAGRAAMRYAYERALYEAILQYRYVDSLLRDDAGE